MYACRSDELTSGQGFALEVLGGCSGAQGACSTDQSVHGCRCFASVQADEYDIIYQCTDAKREKKIVIFAQVSKADENT